MFAIIRLIISVIFITFAVISCEKEKSIDLLRDEFEAYGYIQAEGPVVVRLTILDSNLKPCNTFLEGENFIFSLAIMNLTDSTLFFKHHNINLEDLFKVYNVNNDGEETYIGKPFHYLFCNKVGGNFIKPGEIWELRISWLKNVNLDKLIQCDVEGNYHTETLPLSPGKYKTEFNSKFTFSDFVTNTITFSYEFEIKYP